MGKWASCIGQAGSGKNRFDASRCSLNVADTFFCPSARVTLIGVIHKDKPETCTSPRKAHPVTDAEDPGCWDVVCKLLEFDVDPAWNKDASELISAPRSIADLQRFAVLIRLEGDFGGDFVRRNRSRPATPPYRPNRASKLSSSFREKCLDENEHARRIPRARR